MRVRYKTKAVGLLAALFLSLGLVSPTVGQNTVEVEVIVVDAGDGDQSFGIIDGDEVTFGEVEADAIGATGEHGLFPATNVQFTLGITGDDKLIRDASLITIELGPTGNDADAYLGLDPGQIPNFDGADQARFQIPGRYLRIAGMNNPQQAKWTGGTGSSGDIWDGSNTPDDAGRVPRAAGNAETGFPIYKVGDIGGTFNNPTSAACNVTTGDEVEAWPETGCGDPSFGEGNNSKQIAYIYEGSGFVEVYHVIELGLKVPAGVYPGTYSGVLTLDWVIGDWQSP